MQRISWLMSLGFVKYLTLNELQVLGTDDDGVVQVRLIFNKILLLLRTLYLVLDNSKKRIAI